MNLFKPWITAVFLLLSIQTIAQEKSKRLFVGDKVPDIEFKGLYNYPSKNARLSDFKGKAVILDFWNRGCSACIRSFPKMENIQKAFKDDLVILLVNDQPDQTRETLDQLFKNSPILGSTTLPMVLGDATFTNTSELFPHWGVPYHVWIDKNGIIQVMTGGEFATKENINKFLKGEKLDIVQRFDIVQDIPQGTTWLNYNNGQFLNNLLYYKSSNFTYIRNKEDVNLNSLFNLNLDKQYYSFFMKPVFVGNKGAALASFYDSNGKQFGNSTNTIPLSDIYYAAYHRTYPTNDKPRFFVEGDSPLNLKAYYIYAATHPNYSDSLYYETLKKDLEIYFGYKAAVETRSVESYILYRTDKPLRLLPKGGPEICEDTGSSKGVIIRNMPINRLLGHLFWSSPQDSFGNHASILDEMGVSSNTKVDINIHSNLQNIAELNKELSKYGLGIKKEQRLLPVLVLRRTK